MWKSDGESPEDRPHGMDNARDDSPDARQASPPGDRYAFTYQSSYCESASNFRW
jgi:hypothetical protein